MTKTPHDVPALRLLIVEDNQERLDRFREWIPDEFRLTCARSAGRALEILRLDPGRVYAGLLLDHDLDQSVAAASELSLSGRQVTERITRLIDPDVPVLIHSVNPLGARRMHQMLNDHGFDVTRIPFFPLNRQRLQRWLEMVREKWTAARELDLGLHQTYL